VLLQRADPERQSKTGEDCLFFVGVTRAKRELLVVSPFGKESRVAQAWLDTGELGPGKFYRYTPAAGPDGATGWNWTLLESAKLATQEEPDPQGGSRGGSERSVATVSFADWGGAAAGGGEPPIPVKYLTKDACLMQFHLKERLRLAFPDAIRPLYPVLHGVVSDTILKVIRLANHGNTSVDPRAARELFRERWAALDITDHPHRRILGDMGERWVAAFAKSYEGSNRTRVIARPVLKHTHVLKHPHALPPVPIDFKGAVLQREGEPLTLIVIADTTENRRTKEISENDSWGVINKWPRLALLLLDGFITDDERAGARARLLVVNRRTGKINTFIFARQPGSAGSGWSRKQAEESKYRLISTMEASAKKAEEAVRQLWAGDICEDDHANRDRCRECDLYLSCPFIAAA
jgi:hypothetical protein